MSNWMWISLYVLGWVVGGAGIARVMLASLAEIGPLNSSDYIIAILLGWILGGAFWPLALLLVALYLGIKRGKGIFSFIIPAAEKRRLAEIKADEQEAELEKLRRQVRELKIKGGELL